MYSIVETCGKQVKVSAGNRLKVSALEGDSGTVVTLDKVLLFADGEEIIIGKPYVSGAVVKAQIINQGKGDKIFVFKKRRRKDYDKKVGHRQVETEICITEVSCGSKKESYEVRAPKAAAAPVAPAPVVEEPKKAEKPKTAKPRTTKAKAAK
ncbi:MAG: 50S ribosomal protein L21 [Fibrobacteres bacterium]|nr:50S ribosomal protein L21 [Fibrobacterota bacterium]